MNEKYTKEEQERIQESMDECIMEFNNQIIKGYVHPYSNGDGFTAVGILEPMDKAVKVWYLNIEFEIIGENIEEIVKDSFNIITDKDTAEDYIKHFQYTLNNDKQTKNPIGTSPKERAMNILGFVEQEKAIARKYSKRYPEKEQWFLKFGFSKMDWGSKVEREIKKLAEKSHRDIHKIKYDRLQNKKCSIFNKDGSINPKTFTEITGIIYNEEAAEYIIETIKMCAKEKGVKI